ncbi:MAG: hypothetical protein ACLFT6_03850 [Bacteroidales bacterium]
MLKVKSFFNEMVELLHVETGKVYDLPIYFFTIDDKLSIGDTVKIVKDEEGGNESRKILGKVEDFLPDDAVDMLKDD